MTFVYSNPHPCWRCKHHVIEEDGLAHCPLESVILVQSRKEPTMRLAQVKKEDGKTYTIIVNDICFAFEERQDIVVWI
jgi:hypothetical protein